VSLFQRTGLQNVTPAVWPYLRPVSDDGDVTQLWVGVKCMQSRIAAVSRFDGRAVARAVQTAGSHVIKGSHNVTLDVLTS
jgi:hypothetical protein